MEITFNILDSEADSIAAHNGYDAAVHGTKADFVLEFFKQAGRVSVIGEENSKATVTAEATKAAAVELVKNAISF